MVYFLNKVNIKISQILWTFFLKINLKSQKIRFGKNLKTYGKTIVIKYPGSELSFGQNLRFRSQFRSNSVGLYRRNILSTLTKEAKIQIGNNSGFSGVAISAAKSVIIGDNVMVGANVTITDTDWHPIRVGESVKTDSIFIGNNVWIGLNSTILKGVEIGDNTVIGANSLVIHSIAANSIAAGNPCRVVKSLNNENHDNHHIL